MKHIFIVNPDAGRHSATHHIREAVAACPEHDCIVIETKCPRDATHIVDECCERYEGSLRFYACGGDGTINEVAEGVYHHSDRASLGCYPCGSGNDFVKYYGGSHVFLDSFRAQLDADERSIDLMRVNDRIAINITNFGFDTVVANDGEQAVEYASKYSPDLILLDIMLPKLDGWQVCREIRKTSETPIIMLTAKGETFDKILGLELGADDYVSKPFNTKEVIARIKAVLRRTNDSDKGTQISEVRYDKLRINLTNYELEVNGVKIDTPPKELELIYHLASNPNRVYTRDQLLDKVWGFDYLGDSRTVDVHVKRLREKLEPAPATPVYIITKWGVGYYFKGESQPAI